jgi:hypothetical protein
MTPATPCPKCGPRRPPADLVAKQLRGINAIVNRKLVVPDAAINDLREVAAQLRCLAGLCGARGDR